MTRRLGNGEAFFSFAFHAACALSAPSGQRYSRFAAFPMAGRILDFSLLSLEGGAPKGRRLAPAAG